MWDSATLRSRSASVLGYTNNALTKPERRDALLAVLALAAGGALDVSHERLPMHQLDLAWERQRAGARRADESS